MIFLFLMDCFEKTEVELNKEDIFYVRYITEGYDGLCTVSTVNTKEARVSFSYPSGMKDSMLALIEVFREEGVIRRVFK